MKRQNLLLGLITSPRRQLSIKPSLMMLLSTTVGEQRNAIAPNHSEFRTRLMLYKNFFSVFVFYYICLALLPLVNEINFFGIHLKNKIDEAEKKLSLQISSLRADIQNNVVISPNIAPHVTVNNAPQPDAQLPEIEELVSNIVKREMEAKGISASSAPANDFTLSDDVVYLISVRIKIEQQIRRIFSDMFPHQTGYTSIVSMTRALTNRQVITAELAHAIFEVYRACSGAAHGEDATSAQVSFVRDVAPGMLTTLQVTTLPPPHTP